MANNAHSSAPAGHESGLTDRFDAQLAELAAAQDGVVALPHLRELGLSNTAVHKRAVAGRLHRVHQGVYALIPLPLLTVRGRYRAAVLACGPTAALSHRSAADLHGLRPSHRRAVEVIVPGRTTHRHPGIEVHRATHLDQRDITIVDGIPITTVARTHLDLAAVVPRRALERALDQAEILQVFDLGALSDQIARNPGHPGVGKLRATLDHHTAGDTLTWSELEERFYALTDAAGLPRPEVNAFVDPQDGRPGFRPDFVWRARKLAVEVDGAKTHLTRAAFEEDRARDQRLFAAGWRVIRITSRQLKADPQWIAELLRAHLGG